MRVFFAILGIFLVFMACDYAYIYQQQQVKAQQEAAVAAAAARKAQTETDKKFQVFLNSFLEAVNERAGTYKKQRALVDDLVKPENLKSPEYITQNYQMMLTTVPDLDKRMDSFMVVFQAADAQMKQMVLTAPADERKGIADSWEKMRDKESKAYLAYFTAEQDILKAYEDLMKYYYDKRNEMALDPKSNSLSFRDNADKAREGQMLANIDTMKRQQTEMLANAPQPQEK